jgi:methylthioribulose-1-phosphate dehydratase
MTAAKTARAARELARIGRGFHARGWALGTSGNFSAVVSRRPLRLVITASGVSKGCLAATDFLTCDSRGIVVGRRGGRPSAETLLHVEIAQMSGAGAVLHTHSVWSTILSDRHAASRGLGIEGYEMLKGLDGVTTHEHREWIPILENDQDMPRLAARVRDAITGGSPHALLLRRHGLYTWGRTIGDAERHVEIVEFLLETIGRSEEGTPWPR